MRSCECPRPLSVFNGVCGGCLLPLAGSVHGSRGALIEAPTPSKDEEIRRLTSERDELVKALKNAFETIHYGSTLCTRTDNVGEGGCCGMCVEINDLLARLEDKS
jgi:hypothetical protein